MPGIMDFLSGIFGGQEQAPQQQGLTNPDLYNQAPPEFKLPFAYKLAMLGSSINRNYGGAGGMDMSAMTKGYLENQQAQWEWEQDQAERKRKLDLVQKYAEKTGNTELMELFQADPDAAVKFVFGLEAEKAKPKPVHDRPTASIKQPDGTERLVYTDTGEDVIPYTPAPKRDYSGYDPSPDTAQIPVPATGVQTQPVPVQTQPVPTAGVKSDSSAPAVTAPDTTVPAVAPQYAQYPPEYQQALAAEDQRLEQSYQTLLTSNDPKDLERHEKVFADVADNKRDIAKNYLEAKAKAEEPKAFAEGSLVKTPGQPDFTVPKTSTEMSDFNTIANWPPEQRKAYEAHLDSIKSPEARLLRLYNSSTPEDQAKLKMLIQSGSGATAVDEWASFKKKDQEYMAETFQEYSKQAVPAQNILTDMAKLRELLKVSPQGLTMDAIITNYKSGYSASGDSVAAIVNNIIPHLRQEGSGSQSDLEFQGLTSAMVGVMKHPQANQLILEAFENKAKLQVERANIVDQQRRHKITPEEAVAQINEINNRSIISPALKALVDEELGKQRQAKEAETVAPITGRPKLDKAIEQYGKENDGAILR